MDFIGIALILLVLGLLILICGICKYNVHIKIKKVDVTLQQHIDN